MTPRTVLLALLTLILVACDPSEPTGPQLNPGDEGTEGWKPVFVKPPVRKDCSPEQVSNILAPPTAKQPNVVINCNLKLYKGDTITKAVFFQGSASTGVAVDCNGAKIGTKGKGVRVTIRSQEMGNGWFPVHDVTIKNCSIYGSVRIMGMARNGEGKALTQSSRTLAHVSKVRNNAPYRITLDKVAVMATGTTIPLYLAPGTHHSTFTNGTIGGTSSSVMVYFDAETYGNTFSKNWIRAIHAGREAMALDGSSYNTITENQITSPPKGGIFLYRNCGEGGNTRHATPSYNTITDNDIGCSSGLTGRKPAIYLGSRDGERGYCDKDSGSPYGSSVSDQDHARFNKLARNQLHGCMVKTGNKTNHSNTVE